MRTVLVILSSLFLLAACGTDPIHCKHNPDVSSCKALPNDFGEGGPGEGSGTSDGAQ